MQPQSVTNIYNTRLRQIASRIPSGAQSFQRTIQDEASKAKPVTSAANKSRGAATVKPNEKLVPVVFNAHSRDYMASPSSISPTTPTASLYMSDGTMDKRQQIVAYAKQFQGTPYVWGGKSLTNGTDCSGYMQSVFKAFDIEIPRTAYYQSMEGTHVDVENLRKGDLIFYKTADYRPVTHVGMYVGDNKFIHASSSKGEVVISELNSRWRRKIVDTKSFINQGI